ncbi:MAG: DUF1572 family protein [Planctomycetaceae bacterium]|nr:DUF1572 family protein [Planctomycetaceae bacterium]
MDAQHFLDTVTFEMRRTKQLGEKAMAQIDEHQFHWRSDDEANSVAIYIQHLHGNMMSRWIDFLTTDGEKLTRKRDEEFEPHPRSRDELMRLWEQGWACCLTALEALKPSDLDKTVTIRGEPLSVIHALTRQISHYGYHVGQIVVLCRQLKGVPFKSLSTPRGRSKDAKGDYLKQAK